jgi:glyoxylase-like metal-dependent hydrolase (beta-lactamase superfamily II)
VKGYRTQALGDGLYVITDGAYQSMFLTYDKGVVVVDAPPSYSSRIRKAIAHADHIGGARALGGTPIIIAHTETNPRGAGSQSQDVPPRSWPS